MKPSFNIRNSKLLRLFVAVIYFITVLLSNNLILSDLFSYMWFFPLNDNILLAFSLSLAPILFIPDSNKVSSVFISFLYYLVYVPSVISAISYYSVSNEFELVLFAIAFSISIGILCICSAIPSKSIRLNIGLTQTTIQKGFITITIVIASLVIVAHIGNFSFGNILDVYSKREAIYQNRSVGLNQVFLYLVPWLINVFLPITCALALFRKSKSLLYFSLFTYVILFLVLGQKSLFIAPFVLFGVYYSINRGLSFNIMIPVGLTVLLIPSFLLYDSQSTFFITYSALVNQRLIGIQGAAFIVYYDFFSNNFTYFSQVSILSSFLDYPFQNEIPVVLANNYPLGRLNSHFVNQDGLASLGLLGIFIMSIIVGLLFYLIDCITNRKRNFAIVSIFFLLITLLNSSIFTALLTFGLSLYLFVMLIIEPTTSKTIK